MAAPIGNKNATKKEGSPDPLRLELRFNSKDTALIVKAFQFEFKRDGSIEDLRTWLRSAAERGAMNQVASIIGEMEDFTDKD